MKGFEFEAIRKRKVKKWVSYPFHVLGVLLLVSVATKELSVSLESLCFIRANVFVVPFNFSKLLSFIIVIDLQKISEDKYAIKTDPFSYGKYWVSSTIFSIEPEKWSVFMEVLDILQFGFYLLSILNPCIFKLILSD